MARFKKETELGRHIKNSLIQDGWDVYCEVLYRGSVADIVAVKNGKILIVECKLSFGLTVMEQADHWRRLGCAHLVSVAVPSASSFGLLICNWLGLGVMTVSGDGNEVYERNPPRFIRQANPERLLKALKPEQKVAEAGSAGGGYWTPFKETVRNLERFVKANPGCTLKEAMDGIKHHYRTSSSARINMLHWIEAGKVPGVVVKRDGKAITLHRRIVT